MSDDPASIARAPAPAVVVETVAAESVAALGYHVAAQLWVLRRTGTVSR